MTFQISTKTLSNNFSLPVFGIGTYMMGGRRERDEENNDQKDIEAIQAAIDHRVNHIDTAEMYAAGHSEVILGKAITQYDRSDLFIASKVMPKNLHYDDVVRSCEGSLQRMGIECIDLYYIHAPNPDIPLEETLRAFKDLHTRGLIKNIAVSNFSVKRFQEAQSKIDIKIVANQLHYNLMIRENEKNGFVEFAKNNDVFLVTWMPIQRGDLTTKERFGPEFQYLFEKYDKTPSQIAINWLISQKNVVTIAKSSDLKHLEENLGALGWQMEEEDIERLRREFPGQEFVSNRVPIIGD